MTPSQSTLSAEEQEQLLQTIEMFEVIVQANPHDCQSMEILKDAYQKIGRQEETLAMSRKLAETYATLNQYSSAVLEYEGILQRDPDNPEIIAALGEVEERMHKAGQTRAEEAPPSNIDLDFHTAAADGSTLITTAQTLGREAPRQSNAGRTDEVIATLTGDGNEPLGKFLVQHRLVSAEVVASAIERVQKRNKELAANTCAASLLDEIVRRGAAELEALLCGIIDRSKFAYIPLDCYDVDRQIVKMLPETLTLGRLIVPFDVISRTVMIATANPFDASAKEAVQQLLDYNIQWHLAAPGAIYKVLSDTYRIAAPSNHAETIRLAS